MTQTYFGNHGAARLRLAGAHGATLFLVDGPVLRPCVIYNLPKGLIDGIGAVRVGAQCCGRAVAHKGPWIVSDMLADPLFADGRKGALDSPIRAAFSVPVLSDGYAIGSLACHFMAPHWPSQIDIERNEVFAKLLSIALRGREKMPVPEPYFAWPEPAPASTGV